MTATTSLPRTDLPEGEVTFLFTDIAGSTKLLRALGDTYADVLSEHRRMLRDAFASSGGVEVDTQGDAFFVSFAAAESGVRAAVDAQLSLASHPWPDGAAVRVRMGLHTGSARVTESGYIGLAVHEAARIAGAAHGGQILLSGVTAEKARPPRLLDLGEHRLKDLDRPIEIFQLVHDGLEERFPPIKTVGARPNNLPTELSSFVGREAELSELADELQRTRLLTLTGVGGSGKTRLALRLAKQSLGEYPGGVWLVDLAPVAEPALVAAATVRALGLRDEPGRPITETLSEHLFERPTLLLLDNCEHVIEASASLAVQLLAACPRLRVLATSRMPLRVDGESVRAVAPLDTGPAGVVTAGDLAAADGVQLFCERASAVRPSFRLTDDNAVQLAAICTRLDGIPLAIELAAARVRTLSLQQIGDRLSDRLALLTGGARGAPPRQQTLRAALEWSIDLLTPRQAELFGRLSVFAGAFELEAAEVVGGDPSGTRVDVADDLQALVEQSLLVAVDDDDAMRFRMLESVRDLAREVLGRSGDADEVRLRHASWFRDLVRDAAARLHGPSQLAELARLDAAQDDVRASLGWLLVRDGRAAAAMAADLNAYWELRGLWSEGRRILSQVRDLGPGADPAGRALSACGRLTRMQGDVGAARAMQTEALERARAAGDRSVEAWALAGLGAIALVTGDGDAAEELLIHAAAVAEEAGERRVLSAATSNRGYVALERGDLGAATELFTRCLELDRGAGDVSDVAGSLYTLAGVLMARTELSPAEALFEESLDLRRRAGDRWGVAATLDALGVLSMSRGDVASAERLFDEALWNFEEIGAPHALAQTLEHQVEVARARQDWRAAELLAERSLAIRRRVGDQAGVASILLALGTIASSSGELSEGVSLYLQAEAICREHGLLGLLSLVLSNLGISSIRSGDFGRGRVYLDEGREIAERVGAAGQVAMLIVKLAELELREGRAGDAVRLIEDAVERFRQLSDARGAAVAQLLLARALRAAGRPADAARHGLDAASTLAQMGDESAVVAALGVLGCVAADEGRHTQAARFLGAGEAGSREVPGEDVDVWDAEIGEAAVAEIRRAIGDEAFDRAWAEGMALSPDAALAEARSVWPDEAPGTT